MTPSSFHLEAVRGASAPFRGSRTILSAFSDLSIISESPSWICSRLRRCVTSGSTRTAPWAMSCVAFHRSLPPRAMR